MADEFDHRCSGECCFCCCWWRWWSIHCQWQWKGHCCCCRKRSSKNKNTVIDHQPFVIVCLFQALANQPVASVVPHSTVSLFLLYVNRKLIVSISWEGNPIRAHGRRQVTKMTDRWLCGVALVSLHIAITYNFHVNVDSGEWDGDEGVVTALFTVQLHRSTNLPRRLVNVQVGVYGARLRCWRGEIVQMMVIVMMVALVVVQWLLRWLAAAAAAADHCRGTLRLEHTARHGHNEKGRLHLKWGIARLDDADEGAHWDAFWHCEDQL